MLKDVACVLAISTRSLIYLQALVENELIPEKCLILCKNEEEIYKHFIVETSVKQYDYVDLCDTIGSILERNQVDYTILETEDINSELAYTYLSKLPQKYIIYSGYGGCILQEHLFSIDKNWLHVHAGKLPEYRGSTTAYYSLLSENVISATAIFLTPNIDDGNIVCSGTYEFPDEEIDVDYLYEPYIRAQVLVKALSIYVKKGTFSEIEQVNEKAETYYIIHPVLKHIALLKLEKNKRRI